MLLNKRYRVIKYYLSDYESIGNGVIYVIACLS